MRCSKCGADNQDTARFCDSCGAPVQTPCPACGALGRPGARFCDACGAAHSGPPSRASHPTAPSVADIRVHSEAAAPEALDGERKTVTALFADIKGSMDLMEDLDPEAARAIVDPALKLMMDAVHRYGGYVAQSTGDGIFALFGAPLADEDHPQRALYAALKMQEEMRRYSAKLREAGNLPIEARVGLNTGEVVVRSIATGEGHAEYTPIGHSTGLAARMQALAPSGSIAVTQQTRKLCEGFFTFRSLGPTRVKGVSEPVAVFEVTGLGSLRTRLQVAARRGLTRFVGRQREMEAMRAAAEQAKAGHGQIVAAMGEPGVGKSRLFFEFKAASQSGWMVLESLSVSYGKASVFLPVIELLHSYLDIKPEDDTRKRREKVAGRIAILDRALEETLPYLFGLLGLIEGDDPLAGMDAQIRRRRTLDAIKRIILRESLNQPVLLIFEDLHWIDEETQALLNLLVDSIATSRILLLVNYRPDYSHGWGNKTYYAQLRLDPIGDENAEEMLTGLLGGDPNVAPLKRLIVDKTEGNPFFMEETVQALFEDGALVRNDGVKLAKPLERLQIPATVQVLLASRIDRLPGLGKDLLQTLAVIGKEFPLSLVREVYRDAPAHDSDALEKVLSELQSAEFIYEQPAPGDAEYTFKHALTQEVAYHSILTERRKKIHQRVGSAIEALYWERLEDHLAELAHHYRRSADPEKAVAFLKRSADQAAQRASMAEAEAQYRDALSVLKELPSTRERDRLELGIQLGLIALLIGKGFGASAREEALIRATELSNRAGDRRELLGLLFQRGQFCIQRLRCDELRQVSERGIALARSIGDQIQEGGAWHNLAESFFWSGDPLAAKTRCEKAWELLAPLPPESLVPLFGFDLWMFSSWILGLVELILGRPNRSLEWQNPVLERAGSSSHMLSKAFGMITVSDLAILRRDLGRARDCARIAREICEERGFAEPLHWTIWTEGHVRFWQGEREAGILHQKRANEELEALGTHVMSSWRLACLAEAQLQLGELDAAESSLKRAFEIVKETGEGWAEPEVHRVAAEAVLRQPGRDAMDAQRRFEDAVAIAQKQSSKWWELRATVGLARLLRDTGRRDEARTMLAEIYGWFTEGFDTADLKDAKVLLDELAR
jgi:class 3 adenylate cyclase/tetratricopeptide (TPR) repeat protein